LAPTGRRTGLRAAHQFHLSCNAVHVSPDQIVARGSAARDILARVLACDWLGQAAIALGAARAAIRDARTYAAERYQGGGPIAHHPAVQLLLGTAESDTALLEAIAHRHAGRPLAGIDSTSLLRWAAAARLAAGEHGHRAVTHSLQVLGGYGYMEDYRMEKRLRDVSVVKSLHGAPDQLRLLLAEIDSTREER
jgi:alkylation response protein AidB-like acyl-CoA dehydrogenase